jgi:putative membrane protein insertion efficiency factor
VPTQTVRSIAAAALAVAVVSIASMNAQAITIAASHGYQRSIAPLAAKTGARCRFTPTCSRYAEAVLARDGVVRGGWKTLKRIARCGPWTPPGTVDVP